MSFLRTSLVEAVFVLVFAISMSTSGIKTYSLLSRTDFPMSFYLVGGIVSLTVLSAFLFTFFKMRALVRGAA